MNTVTAESATLKVMAIVLIHLMITSCSHHQTAITIYRPVDVSDGELLAIKELQRYLYVRAGELPEVKMISELASEDRSIVVGTVAHLRGTAYSKVLSPLKNDEYQLKSTDESHLVISGGNDTGTLYAVYKFLESTGIGFALHGDIIPDQKTDTINLSGFDRIYKPSFALRGIQPFHDFPEGPDWWNEDDYEMIISQLPKMGMNFIGFHTYPEKIPFAGFYKAEPQVWIGTKDMFNDDGTVKVAYPVLNSNTGDSTWSFYPKKTSDFNFGAAMIFESEVYGTDFMKNVTPWPHTTEENIKIFNGMGTLLNHSFTLAKRLGVKTCVGTEIPLTIPAEVERRLDLSKNKDSDASRLAVYEGTFARIKSTYPLDYFWFWTPEDWTWKGEDAEAVERTENDFKIAIEAKKNVDAPFTLATCGWVLGPGRNRAEFDELLPKEMPFAVINREIGFTPVEPAFKNINNRPKWQISWIEDDNSLTTPQFWAGRVMRDAFDAHSYGCNGMMGIHWRTKNLSPAFMALAKSGWEASSYQSPGDSVRHFNADALYAEWATQQFGKEAALILAPIFSKLDGGNYTYGSTMRHANFPRTSEWGKCGPGIISINSKPWKEMEPEFAFVDILEGQRKNVKGIGNITRFEYWLNTFKYAKTQAQIGCILGQMRINANLLEKERNKDKQKDLAEQIINDRTLAAKAWGELITLLLEAVSTTGEMGTLANYEQQNLESFKHLTRYDELLTKAKGQPVAAIELPKAYKGSSRLVVTTQRSLLVSGEPLTMKVRVLTSDAIESVVIYWKGFGETQYKNKMIKAEARNVFNVTLDPSEFNATNFEYYVEVKTNKNNLRHPLTLGQNQTVVIW